MLVAMQVSTLNIIVQCLTWCQKSNMLVAVLVGTNMEYNGSVLELVQDIHARSNAGLHSEHNGPVPDLVQGLQRARSYAVLALRLNIFSCYDK